MSSQTILIPIEFPDPDPLPSTFIDGFTSCRIILLGLYELDVDINPDEQHRREIEAYNTLYTLAAQFVRRGDTAEVELTMGPDVVDAPTRMAEERDVDALLMSNPITTLGRVLISIREEKFAQPISDFVSTLNQDVILHTTLFHVAETEDDVEHGREILSNVREHLVDSGFPTSGIDTEVVVSSSPPFEIGKAAEKYDLLIMGETQDPAFERVFGKTYELIAEETDRPIVVVRDHE